MKASGRASAVAQLPVSNAIFWPVAFGRGLAAHSGGLGGGTDSYFSTWDQCRQATGGVVFGSWSGIDPVDPPAPFGLLGLDHQAELLLQRAAFTAVRQLTEEIQLVGID